MSSADDVRALALKLPRSYQVEVRGVEKFRVGRIVWLAFSADDSIAGLAFAKEERDGVIAAEPKKFKYPRASDLRYNWIHVRLAALPDDEMRELVIDAWRMCVPKRVAADIDESTLLQPARTSSRRCQCERGLSDAESVAPPVTRRPRCRARR